MWKWIAAVVLALVVGFVFGKVTSMHHEKYGYKPPYHNKFSKIYNDRGMGPQCMCGSFNNGPMGPMMGKGPSGQPMGMRMPNPGNNMPSNCGCRNKSGNDGNKGGCRCGCNKEAPMKMEFGPGPKPGNNCDMNGNCGCRNKPGNDGNKGGCRCGPDREGGNKMERKHGDDWWDVDNENEDDDEDND